MNLKKNTFLRRNSYLLVTAAWLITISFIIDNYWSGNATPLSVKRLVEKNIQTEQREIESFCKDTALLNKLIQQKYNEETVKLQTQKKYFFFIYSVKQFTADYPVFWNTQIIQPTTELLSASDGSNIQRLSNGWYVVDKRTINSHGSSYKIIFFIPVKWEYYIENKYLQNSFVAVKNIENEYAISKKPAGDLIKGINGSTLFYLQQTDAPKVLHDNTLALWLKIIASLLILLFIHLYASYFLARRGLVYGFMALIIPVIVLRVLSYYLPIPFNLRQFELFDPAIYGSSPILRSLGDLFINSLLFVWIILFVRYHLQEKNIHFKLKNALHEIIGMVALSVTMIIITILCGRILQSLVADSQISFDVINFFSLNIYTAVGFIVLSCIATGYFFLSQILLYVSGLLIRGRYYMVYIIIPVLGLIYLTFNLSSTLLSFDMMLLMWLILFVFLMNYTYLALLASKIVASRFIFWIFFFSVSITAIIVFENKTKELNTRKHLAENLANKSDMLGETMVNILLSGFKNGFLSDVFERFKNQAESRVLKDSLISQNFSAYLDKYDTRIYTFNESGRPLFNEDSTNYNTLNTIIETQGKPTRIPELYYYDVSYDQFNYLSKKEVTDRAGNLLGYIFVLSKPKKYKSDAIYPELFSKGHINSIENSSEYAYAVYDKGQLKNSYNDYPFPTTLTNFFLTSNDFKHITRNGYDELWYKANEDKVIVITRPHRFFIESITLFAYLFCSFLLLGLAIRLLNIMIQAKFSYTKVKALWQLTIRNQIHGIIIFISILSFIIVGATTILFFIGRYNNNNKEKLSVAIHIMENEVRNSLAAFAVMDDEVKVYDSVSNEKLSKTINRIAEIHAADINLYDLNGDLKVSSLPLPYEKGIVSSKMDPLAFYHLSKLKDVQFFEQQEIGALKYLSDYVPVRDDNGNEYAYLNIPYFVSQSKLEDEISNFLVTIINLNAFIFLIAGIVALFITNRITRSFSFISHKMQEVNLGKVNEPIVWNRKDEIGELVNEYNKMVAKLDTSAEMLARSEREGAWREMARQVAHEIKNPLTPMKLNLQYLQMAIDNNSPQVKDISAYVAKILVEQIDHLSQIAGDFAQFANIGQSKDQVFDLNDSLEQVTSLYSTNETLSISLHLPHQKIMIEADRTQINRLFTNLLLNAIQSVPDTEKAEIKIDTIVKDKKIIVSITDNGTGIPDDMTGKIFTPNFTTKTSGTGLGLAMCKGIVEKVNGKIWFETVVGEYTTFFVELPILS